MLKKNENKMTLKNVLLVILFTFSCYVGHAQDGGQAGPPKGIRKALLDDDSTLLATFVTKANVNDCYGNYSVLSQTIRVGAIKCFYFLLGVGADVNKSCNGYVPPLMHAAKYGRLEMVKVLVAKGADVHYKYEGNGPAEGQTPLSYAEMFQKMDVVAYLKSVK
jgi:ankyrin repeat protein